MCTCWEGLFVNMHINFVKPISTVYVVVLSQWIYACNTCLASWNVRHADPNEAGHHTRDAWLPASDTSQNGPRIWRKHWRDAHRTHRTSATGLNSVWCCSVCLFGPSCITLCHTVHSILFRGLGDGQQPTVWKKRGSNPPIPLSVYLFGWTCMSYICQSFNSVFRSFKAD